MAASLCQLERGLKPLALVQVTVPSIDAARRHIDERVAVQMIFDTFLEVSTGATAIRGEGIWRQSDGQTVREPIVVVFSHLPQRLTQADKRRFVYRIARFAEWAHQDALLVVVNNRAFLVKPRECRAPRLAAAVQEEARLAAG